MSQALAKTAASVLPAGFENVSGADLLMPKIKLYHPMSKTEVEGGKIGQWYEANEAKNLGVSIKFCLLGQKTMIYNNKDDEGEMVQKTYKKLLVYLPGSDVPAEIVLSVTSMVSFKKLLTTLLVKSKEKGGAPSFAFLVEGKIKVVEGAKGKYGVADFSVVGDTPEVELVVAADLYAQHGRNYQQVVEAAPSVDVAPGASLEEVSAAL